MILRPAPGAPEPPRAAPWVGARALLAEAPANPAPSGRAVANPLAGYELRRSPVRRCPARQCGRPAHWPRGPALGRPRRASENAGPGAWRSSARRSAPAPVARRLESRPAVAASSARGPRASGPDCRRETVGGRPGGNKVCSPGFRCRPGCRRRVGRRSVPGRCIRPSPGPCRPMSFLLGKRLGRRTGPGQNPGS